MMPRPPTSTLFPYTTLFRSSSAPLSSWPPGLSPWVIAGTGSTCPRGDRKSTRLNSSHLVISYAVFCLKKKSYRRHLLTMVTPNDNHIAHAEPDGQERG